MNFGVDCLWLDMTARNSGLESVRVESKAHAADGPTSDVFSYIDRLGAVFADATLPERGNDLWTIPFISVSQ